LHSSVHSSTIQLKGSGDQPKVIEVFEATIGNPQHHHSVELFRNYRFDRIGAKMRCWGIEESRVVDFDRPRRDDISKADVYLNGDSCVVNDCLGTDSNPTVLNVFADWRGRYPLNVEGTPSSGTGVEHIALKVPASASGVLAP
jgi:hypothetical protein